MKAYNSNITVEEFIAQHATSHDPATDNYFREPFAKDTKVGKNSAIYNAHSYHTKVPPKGIVPYILHYTEPGDLILTGTPEGVGVFRDPKVSLTPGDVVEVEVEGVGVLRNDVRAA